MTAPKKTQPRTETEDKLATVPLVGGKLQPSSLQEAIELAKLFASSGMVPKDYVNNPGAVLIAMEMGAELGLPPTAALQNIAVINGRPSLWGDAGLAIVRSHPGFVDIVEELDTSDPKNPTAVCTLTRRGQSPTVRTFSWADAAKAGLASKQGTWKQYPKRMLQMRARWFAMRDAFPDALRGIHSAEESGDIVESRPEYVDDSGKPKEGKHTFGRRASQETQARVDVPMPPAPEPPSQDAEIVDEEPPHDPDTGEVKEEPPAEPATEKNGQQGLDW